ncbi:Scr1 family TA system antitoxin-like transcriptional regulator [Actinoplanes sp. NPDC048791]|uniref:helix-turn-helix domain-containing protein n=1 Tax=Actinoplanes sp. NPDC048791 TaxID=3154623 RepID=UPI0033F45861
MTDKLLDALPNHRELARVQLGASIRKIRQQATIKQAALARAAHMSQPKISKIELGDVAPSITDIRSILAVLKPAEEIEQKILAQFDLLDMPEGDRRAIYQLGIASKQRQFRELEKKAERIRVFDTSVLPGLMQTEAYARGIVTGLAPFPQNEIDEAVDERMRRQERLWEAGKSFEFIILEAALWARHCTAEEHLAQLDRIRQLMTRPNIRFGIVRANSPLPNVINAFWLFDEDYVSAETIASEVISISPESIREYIRAFESLTALAMFDSAADAVIGEAMVSLERSS